MQAIIKHRLCGVSRQNILDAHSAIFLSCQWLSQHGSKPRKQWRNLDGQLREAKVWSLNYKHELKWRGQRFDTLLDYLRYYGVLQGRTTFSSASLSSISSNKEAKNGFKKLRSIYTLIANCAHQRTKPLPTFCKDGNLKVIEPSKHHL